jgi:hypothetical protein
LRESEWVSEWVSEWEIKCYQGCSLRGWVEW